MTAQQLHNFLTFHWSSKEPDLLFTIEKREPVARSTFDIRPPRYFVCLYAILPKKDELISEEDFLTETGARERFEKKVEQHYTPDQESALDAPEVV